jgi:hypothetical protein
MSVKTVVPGALVTKAAANLPQTATANLFTVAGGAVLVTGLLGQVTTVLGATATTLSLGVTGNTTAITTATAINGSAVGTLALPVKGVPPAALVVAGAAFILAPPFIIDPFIVAVANITWTTSASTTGQMKWSLWYVPLDSGATVS